MTTDTLAKLAADLEQLASEGPELIHTQSGAHISQKLSEAAKALAAQALVGGRCDECGKDQAEGWALYCVGCLEKTGLLAKEALPNAQHVSSTAADLTGTNDTAAQATTGAPSEYSQWAGRPTVLENAIAHIDAQALRLEAAERDASERAKAQATRLCDDFERLGAINRSKWVSTNHGKWEGMAIAYEQAALKCRRAAIASEAAT